jgi:oxygen-independent coproporphyrinogen III oxidase
VYAHVPFCARRCSYCDFSIAVRREVPVRQYVESLALELSGRYPPDEPWEADTLYLGGGTPSRLGGDGIGAVLGLFRSRLELAPDAEVTIEANPEDVTRANAAAWVAAGVNRVSLGVQSFDDRVLAWMHRVHDGDAARRAVDTIRDAGIGNISVDLIFALPPGVERDWERDLGAALALEPAHLSLYGLTVEPHTPLGRRRARGEIDEAPEERYEREFLVAHEVLAASGFEHYEVSNFGRPGRHSRHNSAYWSGVAYAGLGPSAHGFDGVHRYWNVSPYAEWVRRLQAGEAVEDGCELLGADSREAERVYLGLRTSRGLEIDGADFARTEQWRETGWARLDESGRLVLTPVGWLRLDALAADLTAVRSR